MPDHADASNNVGTALLAQARFEEARAAFQQALTHRPDFPEAFYNLGNAWRELGNLSEAIAAYRNALRLRPDYADAFGQLAYHRAQACAWDDYTADQEKLLGMVRQGVRIPPFYLLSTPASAGEQLVCARQWFDPITPPSPGAGAGPLFRLSRYDGGRFDRLHHRRSPWRPGQPAAVLFGAAGASSLPLSGERQAARGDRRRFAAAMWPAGRRLRVLLLQQLLQAVAGIFRYLDAPAGFGSRQRDVAARGQPARAREPACGSRGTRC